MNHASYIADGYTEHGYIKEVPGLHQSLRLDFRPMTIADRDDWQSLTEGGKASEQSDITCRVIAKRIIKWNLKDHEGKAVPVSPQAIARLKPALHVRLIAVVSGAGPSDIDAEAVTGDPEDVKAAAHARLLGGAERLAESQKNSVAG